MKKLRLICVLMLVLFLSAILVVTNGQIYLIQNDWLIHMPAWLFCLALTVVWLIIGLSYNIINYFVLMPDLIKTYCKKRTKIKIKQFNFKGLLALQEDNWPLAEKLLRCDLSLINCLLVAQAAYQQRKWDICKQYLAQAYNLNENYKIAIYVLQAKVNITQQHYQEAINYIMLLSQLAPNHPALPHIMRRITQKSLSQHHWLNLLNLVKQYKIIPADHEIILNIYSSLCQIATARGEHQLLLELWHNLPNKLRRLPKIVVAFTTALTFSPIALAELESIIRKSLKKSWHSDLVLCYGMITVDPVKQLKIVEEWLKSYPREWTSLLTAGRLAIACKLWRQAQSYLTTSLELQPMKETHLVLGWLFAQLGNQQQAMCHYRTAATEF